MTYQRLEECLLRQNYGLLCEMLCYQLIFYKVILWKEASCTSQIKSKNICLKHGNQVRQVNFIHLILFQGIGKDEGIIRHFLYKLICIENILP